MASISNFLNLSEGTAPSSKGGSYVLLHGDLRKTLNYLNFFALMRKATGTRVAEPERAEHFHLSHLSRKGMAASTCGLVRKVTKAGNMSAFVGLG